MRLTRIAALVFGALAVGALAAGIVVDEVYPDQSEGWGLLLFLIAFVVGPIAVLCGLVVAVRVHGIHRSRIGGTLMVIFGAALLVWLGRTLFHA